MDDQLCEHIMNICLALAEEDSIEAGPLQRYTAVYNSWAHATRFPVEWFSVHGVDLELPAGQALGVIQETRPGATFPRVKMVHLAGWAEGCGVWEGDLIVSLNGEAVDMKASKTEFMETMRDKSKPKTLRFAHADHTTRVDESASI